MLVVSVAEATPFGVNVFKSTIEPNQLGAEVGPFDASTIPAVVANTACTAAVWLAPPIRTETVPKTLVPRPPLGTANGLVKTKVPIVPLVAVRLVAESPVAVPVVTNKLVAVPVVTNRLVAVILAAVMLLTVATDC